MTSNDSAADLIPVGEAGIRLAQLLKLTGVVDTGGGARALLADGEVTVNGEVEVRRGRQLVVGDVVDVAGHSFRLT